jgi:hypothetical protein
MFIGKVNIIKAGEINKEQINGAILDKVYKIQEI